MGRADASAPRRPGADPRPDRPRPPTPIAPNLSKARVSLLKALRDKRRRQVEGKFLVEGYHIVEEALRAGAPVEEILAGAGWSKSPGGERLTAIARERRVPVVEVPRRVLEDLSDAETSQGVLAVVRMAPPAEFTPAPGTVSVLLDGVQDPGNAGAILRAADAFGCAAVLFGRGCVEPLNPKVLRAAQGSHFHLPVIATPPAGEVVARARVGGARVLATAARGGRPLWEFRRGDEPLLLLFGNEARGVTPDALKGADDCVSIPQRGRAESLGVAAAAAVVLAWLTREGTS